MGPKLGQLVSATQADHSAIDESCALLTQKLKVKPYQ
jgi:hypothetical protein